MSTLREWINRLRHNRGYGVQSPAAFHFVMHVLREGRHRYYSYQYIDNIAKRSKEYSPAHCRRLFRIANALHPQSILSIDNGKCVEQVLKTACNNAKYSATQDIEHFTAQLMKEPPAELLMIGDTPHYAKALDKALPHAKAHTAIIIENIRSSAEKKAWWQHTINRKEVVVSMDLYNTGLLFFDPQYRKQHYTFHFK